MTNGEKIKEIFTDEWWNAEYQEPTTKKDCNTCTHSNETDGSNCYECVKDMCNNYEPTTKNNLGVDAISRADARSLVVKIGNKDILGMSGKTFQDLYKGIDELSSVTPIRPKGHWIEHEKSISTAFKHLRECSCCKCYFDWMMPRNSYCPNCGADMREVEE